MVNPEYKHSQLTSEILRTFFDVYNKLGYGFLEKVYENALAFALRKQGYKVEQQLAIKVFYEGCIVGEYFADILINDIVIVEIKVASEIAKIHEMQLVNYLKATGKEIGLLLNFGPKAECRRKIYELRQHKDDQVESINE